MFNKSTCLENLMHTLSFYSNSRAWLFFFKGEFLGHLCIMDIMSRVFIDCSPENLSHV